MSILYRCTDRSKNTLYSTVLERTARLIYTTLPTRLFAFVRDKQGSQGACHPPGFVCGLTEKFCLECQRFFLRFGAGNAAQHFHRAASQLRSPALPCANKSPKQRWGLQPAHDGKEHAAPSMLQRICFPSSSMLHSSRPLQAV